MPPILRRHSSRLYYAVIYFLRAGGIIFGRPFKPLSYSAVTEAAENNEGDYDDEPGIFVVECIGKATAHK